MAFVYNTNFNSPKQVLSFENEQLEITPLRSDEKHPSKLSFYTTVGELDPNNSNITLYWTTSSGDGKHEFLPKGPLTSDSIKQLPIDNIVETLHKNDSFIYIGGQFNTPQKKLCTVNINNNTLSTDTLNYFGPLKDRGSIRTITTQNDLLILGGDFEGDAEHGGVLGKGLAIINTKTKQHFPFYINGTVNAVEIFNNYLYVGGNFDYINYTAQPVSELTGLRVYTKGLFRIDLNKIVQFPQHCIDREFVNNISTVIDAPLIVNILTSIDKHLYIGGNFEITIPDQNFKSKSIVRITSTGDIDTNWDPIFDGEISCIEKHKNHIYVGGLFSSFVSNKNFSTTNDRPLNRTHNLVRFNNKHENLIFDVSWIPQFNGNVTSLAFQGSYVYCYGSFTKLNDNEVGHLAVCNAEAKSSDVFLWWPYSLQSGPISNTGRSMITLGDKLLIGGTFLQCNDESKQFLTYVPYINPNKKIKTSKVKLSCRVHSHGTKLNSKASSQIKRIIVDSPYTINSTIFDIKSKELIGCAPGTLVKFTLERIFDKNDPLADNICLLGWGHNS